MEISLQWPLRDHWRGCILGASLATSSPAVCRIPQQCSGPVLSALWKSQLLFHSLGWWGRLQDQKQRLLVLTTCLYLKVSLKWNANKNWSESIYIKLTTLVALGDGAESWAQVWGQRRLQSHLNLLVVFKTIQQIWHHHCYLSAVGAKLPVNYHLHYSVFFFNYWR